MKKIHSIFILMILIFANQACAKTSTVVVQDLTYMRYAPESELQKLDIILPESSEKTPLLVWIGGGAWSYVDRKKEKDIAANFAEQGIAVAAVGHRLSPATWQDPSRSEGIQHPGHIEDIAAALKWLIDRSEDYNFDKTRIYVGGFSSGGHLAALLVSDSSYLKAHGLSTGDIKGIIPIGGSYDILDYHRVFKNGNNPNLAVEHVEAVFGSSKEQMRAASPISYVDDLSTPMLLISDNRTYNYTKLYEDALYKAGKDEINVLHIRNLGHGELWQQLSYADQSPYRDIILAFIKSGMTNNQ